MKIEFNTVYTDFENMMFAKLYVKYCDDATVKKMKTILIAFTAVVVLAIIPNLILRDFFIIPVIAIWYLITAAYYLWYIKKALPKNIEKSNRIICPSKITMGFYDEYFYEKCESNMQVSENSVRYEFLKKVVETDEYFLLISKNHRGMILSKAHINPPEIQFLSSFFRNRVPHIYKKIK